jgi:hypothetical protein
VKSGSTADTGAGGPLDGVAVTILDADKRIGTHVFRTVARNDAGQGSDVHPLIKSLVFMMVYQTLINFAVLRPKDINALGQNRTFRQSQVWTQLRHAMLLVPGH